MDIDKMIEQFRTAADKWEAGHQIILTGELRVQDALRDAATALSTLQTENKKLRAELERKNEALDFARTKDAEIVRLGTELERVKRENNALWTYIEIVDREYRRYMDRGYVDRLDELKRTWKCGQKED